MGYENPCGNLSFQLGCKAETGLPVGLTNNRKKQLKDRPLPGMLPNPTQFLRSLTAKGLGCQRTVTQLWCSTLCVCDNMRSTETKTPVLIKICIRVWKREVFSNIDINSNTSLITMHGLTKMSFKILTSNIKKRRKEKLLSKEHVKLYM